MRSTSTLLRQGPGPKLAFLATADAEAIAEGLTALANTEGGQLVLGIGADGEFGDIYLEDEVEAALQAALRQCNPPVKSDWLNEQVRGHTVVVLTVPKSDTIHTLVDGRVLMRKGSQTAPAGPEDLALLMAMRPTGDFELQPVPGAKRDDLDDEVISAYMEQRRIRNPQSRVMSTDTLLMQIGALTPERAPTISGLLLFGKEPQTFLPQSRAIFVKFADTAPRGEKGEFGHGRRAWTGGHHIIDPRTGYPAQTPWWSVTAVAATAADANAAATAGVILGDRGPAWMAQQGIDARFVSRDETLTTGRWKQAVA